MALAPLRNLFPRITSFSNLLAAARKAQKGKRYRADVLAFNANLELELFQLQHELEHRTYAPGPYRRFHIRDPKPRWLHCACGFILSKPRSGAPVMVPALSGFTLCVASSACATTACSGADAA